MNKEFHTIQHRVLLSNYDISSTFNPSTFKSRHFFHFQSQQPPKKLSNDLKVTEEINTIYMIRGDDGETTVIDPNAKEEEGPDE